MTSSPRDLYVQVGIAALPKILGLLDRNRLRATDATSIYVAQSNAWQTVSLLPWTDYSALLDELRRSGYAKITRTLVPSNAA
jgi:hypothetical protein